jgi:hypothetical protein
VADVKTYTVHAVRSEGWWGLTVPEVAGAVSQRVSWNSAQNTYDRRPPGRYGSWPRWGGCVTRALPRARGQGRPWWLVRVGLAGFGSVRLGERRMPGESGGATVRGGRNEGRSPRTAPKRCRGGHFCRSSGHRRTDGSGSGSSVTSSRARPGHQNLRFGAARRPNGVPRHALRCAAWPALRSTCARPSRSSLTSRRTASPSPSFLNCRPLSLRRSQRSVRRPRPPNRPRPPPAPGPETL